MRKSHIVLLSAFAFLVLLVAGGVIATRIIVAKMESGRYADAAAASAEPVSHHPDLSGFSRIDTRGVWDITLTRGPKWDITLDYPPRLKDRVDARVEGDRLLLATNRSFGLFGFSGDNRIKATIVMPALSGLDLAGASTLNVGGFDGDSLSIKASGASKIRGQDSRYKRLDLIVNGAGDVNFSGVVADDARVVLSGAGDVTLNMNGGTLSGTVSGAGKVRYHGTVSKQDVVVNGFSSVEALD
jgi:hypothetical protein